MQSHRTGTPKVAGTPVDFWMIVPGQTEQKYRLRPLRPDGYGLCGRMGTASADGCATPWTDQTQPENSSTNLPRPLRPGVKPHGLINRPRVARAGCDTPCTHEPTSAASAAGYADRSTTAASAAGSLLSHRGLGSLLSHCLLHCSCTVVSVSHCAIFVLPCCW